MAEHSETLKRYLEEDADDLRIIEEARKRMKVRQEQRTIDSQTSASVYTDGNVNRQHHEPPVKVESHGSFELGRNLDDVPTGDQDSTSEYDASLPSSPAGAIVDINIYNRDGSINFWNIVKLFSQSYEHSEPDVLSCGTCCALPDDPVLTDCLHLYCTECFTELLIRYNHGGVSPAPELSCEAEEGDQIKNYIKLSGKMFEILASSVNLVIEGRLAVPFENPQPADMHTCGNGDCSNASMGPAMEIPASELDDISALWDVIVQAKRGSDAHQDNNEARDEVSYGEALSSGGEAKEPFINDGPIKRPFYASESEDLNSDSDSSDEFGDNVSEISRTELRGLWNNGSRPLVKDGPAPTSPSWTTSRSSFSDQDIMLGTNGASENGGQAVSVQDNEDTQQLRLGEFGTVDRPINLVDGTHSDV
ncbi:uncharacterized protein AB675_7998 [Cyphellophora attinorum]|uniref:Zinc finger C3HC4 RING-type domain-containing protein n=1 Tax=Cyphellophora attinorum TaxID=1664694 RepID=A0A0N0NNC1_9EURO|nr:uncharacterized protein AB675_7998 [Phialophora attinorum]KPI41199.1 hypothetical protein AB675_7998 [Phialophora attinorum]